MLFIIILFLSILLLQKIQIQKFEGNIKKISIESSYDIIKPKFTINNEKQNISVTANQGNFVNKDQVLLKDNVLFESSKFKIFTEEVLFNKKNQTAKSFNDSLFISDSTKIKAEGFDIIEKGNIIQFNGKTSIILSQ